MRLLLVILCTVFLFFCTNAEDLVILSKVHSSFLEEYTNYGDVVLLRFQVPSDTSFVSFKFEAEELDMSIFRCNPRDVIIYLKEGSPPVINPDESKFPDGIFNMSRPQMYYLQMESDETPAYVNLTAPVPGYYYAAAFLPWQDPTQAAITQEGLTAQCFTSLEGTLYSAPIQRIEIIIPNMDLSVMSNASGLFKFYLPQHIDHIAIIINNINFTATPESLNIRVQSNRIPTAADNLANLYLSEITEPFSATVWTKEESWHYIQFNFTSNTTRTVQDNSTALFRLKLFPSIVIPTNYTNNTNNDSIYHGVIYKIHNTDLISQVTPYNQYNLVKDVSSESFMFSYDLEVAVGQTVPVPVNVTTRGFTALHFRLVEGTDIGGTLQFILAFKRRVRKGLRKLTLEDEPKSHTVVACIRRNIREIPIWPDKCSFNGIENPAPLILNSTVDNTTVYIPYPEPGVWFVTFKLFDGSCDACRCSDSCSMRYVNCTDKCERNCTEEDECAQCRIDCKAEILKESGCSGCNCDGNCLNKSTVSNTSVLFDISSYPCMTGKCGDTGECLFMVSAGVVFSTCSCSNNYRGWDCTDDTFATSYLMIVIELLLLVLSNIAFVPAVYFAFKRRYYVESTVYAAICFFSTFYHACDAGENIISFCITRVSVLQFADFYSALMSIWVTIIAMTNLQGTYTSILHMLGAILIAVGVTWNRYSLWVFLIPTLIGIVILIASWYWYYRKNKHLPVNKRYLYVMLPLGVVLVSVGLILYAAMQTQSNYKYTHSLWHILMAAAVILLLPSEETFVVQPLLQ